MPTSRSLKVVLALSLLVTVSLVGLVVFGLLRAWWSTPISVFGFVPGQVEQPIEFPHPVHVEEAGIQCDFCHRSVAKSEAATVPPLELCVACHRDLPNGTFAGMGHPSVEHVRIMPDCHKGNGCCVGFTSCLNDKIVPNFIGGDIGCGIITYPMDCFRTIVNLLFSKQNCAIS